MSLNIKNERTHALVRELATLTGMSQTDAVTDAVEHRLAQLGEKSDENLQTRVEEIMHLVRQVAPGLRRAWGDRDPTEDLYDESGLPT